MADFAKRPKCDGKWVVPEKLAQAALPTVMRKIISHAHPNIMRPSSPGDERYHGNLAEGQLPHGRQARSARIR